MVLDYAPKAPTCDPVIIFLVLGVIFVRFFALRMRYIERDIWLAFQVLRSSGMTDRIRNICYRVVPCTNKVSLVVEAERVSKCVIRVTSKPY